MFLNILSFSNSSVLTTATSKASNFSLFSILEKAKLNNNERIIGKAKVQKINDLFFNSVFKVYLKL